MDHVLDDMDYQAAKTILAMEKRITSLEAQVADLQAQLGVPRCKTLHCKVGRVRTWHLPGCPNAEEGETSKRLDKTLRDPAVKAAYEAERVELEAAETTLAAAAEEKA